MIAACPVDPEQTRATRPCLVPGCQATTGSGKSELPAGVGPAQHDSKKFRAAGMFSEATMANVQPKFVPSGTGKYELQEP